MRSTGNSGGTLSYSGNGCKLVVTANRCNAAVGGSPYQLIIIGVFGFPYGGQPCSRSGLNADRSGVDADVG